MKIQIDSGGRKLSIGIPTALIFSKPSAWLYLKMVKKNMAYAERYMPDDVDVSVSGLFENLPEDAVYTICSELRRIKKKHGSWELVNVESADGSIVKITL